MKHKRALTKKQKDFVREYAKHGNGVKAALKVYNLGGKGGKHALQTAGSIASENLKKPDVRAFFKGIAQEMADIVREIAREGETHTVRLQAAKDVLDRAGYKPVDSIDVTSGGETIKSIEYVVPDKA